MAFVISSGQGNWVSTPVAPAFGASVRLGDDIYADHTLIWESQRSVRTVVSFLARNIAHIGLHWYRRVSDTDRVRDTTHPIAQLLARPNPVLRLTPYRLFDRLVHDMGIYDNGFWVKDRAPGGAVRTLIPIPPPRVRPTGGNWLAPESYEIWTDGRWRAIAADDVVHFHGYDPRDPRVGNSPMNALRDLMLEEYEATRNRQQMWRNGARLSGVIERPKDAPDWGPTARNRFKQGWRSSFTGAGGEAGGTPLLEDGMTYKAIGLDPKSAQYVESRKLTREEAAAQYHVSPVFVGILDHATYSNITEQHKNLYQDTLGPWLEQFQQDIAEQLLPDFRDVDGLYPEFNIAAKMAGSFEEQATAASAATGAPWMTRNEQRARFNLPALDGGDELITPLNVLIGGLASPRDTAPKRRLVIEGKAAGAQQTALPQVSGLEKALLSFLDEQASALAARLGVKALPSLDEAWSDESDQDAALAGLLLTHATDLAEAAAAAVFDEHNPDREGWSADRMQPWLASASATYAHAVNKGTRTLLLAAMSPLDGWEDRVRGVLEDRASYARLWAQRVMTECASFGGQDAAKASGLSTKTWRAGDDKHAALDGTTVELAAAFPDVGRWPGDFRGGRDNADYCFCALTFA